MAKHVVIAGQAIHTPQEVLEVYRPTASSIPEAEWKAIRPVVVPAVAAAAFASPYGTLTALRYTVVMVSWVHREGLGLDPEVVFDPLQVERFVATQLGHMSPSGRSTVRGHLRRVARAGTRHAAWGPVVPSYPRTRPIAPPYTREEVEGFWRVTDAQPTQKATRVLTALLTLTLGAGLRPGELLTVTSGEHVRRHPSDERLWVILLPDRTVPVLHEYVPALRQLCLTYPEGPLIGSHRPEAKDPLGVLRKCTRIPKRLPPLRAPQLRSTWMSTVLSGDVRISEFMAIAGVVSAKSLENVAPFVPVRWDSQEYLVRGAGLC